MAVVVVKYSHAIFLNGQFMIVYTCKPQIISIFSSYRLVTPRIFSSKMLYFGWWENDRDTIFPTVTTIWKPGLMDSSLLRRINTEQSVHIYPIHFEIDGIYSPWRKSKYIYSKYIIFEGIFRCEISILYNGQLAC